LETATVPVRSISSSVSVVTVNTGAGACLIVKERVPLAA